MQPDNDALDRADMAALVSGRESGLDSLMARHAQKLFAYCCRLLQNETEAEETAEETFVKVFQSADRYDPSQKFTTWLYTIASNLVKDRFRYRSRHPNISIDANSDEHSSIAAMLPDQRVVTPAEQLATSERARAVQQAIADLPVELRTSLILFEYEDLPQAEIAEILSTSTKVIENRLYRARKLLRERLSEWIIREQ